MKQEDNQKKKKRLLRFGGVFLGVLFLMASLVMGISIDSYYDNMYDNGKQMSKVYTNKYAQLLNDYFSGILDELDQLCENADAYTSSEDVQKKLFQFVEMHPNKYELVYYGLDGILYDSHAGEKAQISEILIESMEKGFDCCSGIVNGLTGPCVAVCKHVDNKYFDCIVGCVSTRTLEQFVEQKFYELQDMPQCEQIMFCDRNGALQAFVNQNENGFDYELHATDGMADVKVNTLYSLFEDKATTIDEKLRQHDVYSTIVDQKNTKYVFSASALPLSYGRFVVATMYLPTSLVVEQNQFISIILVCVCIILCAMVALVLFAFHYRKKILRQIDNAEKFDPITGVNTYKMFKTALSHLLDHNRGSKYAVIYFCLNQFDILYENYGENATNDIISFCGKVIEKTLDKYETYGHISDGKFVMAMHYKDVPSLINKMGVVYALINNYNKFSKGNYTLNFTAGIYLVDRTADISIDMMLSDAIVAQRTVTITMSNYYCIYDEKIDEARQVEREIELRKEQAFKNKEFLVFFQPKLNLQTGRLDGAEALVRWYYPETDTVYSPGKFLPIFEMNGFVEKLDKYVYLEVLEFMSNMVKKGRRVCPISVNVSRFTALQPDFLTFYIQNKSKYDIADDFIYLEFTESFAYDNNDKLRQIVEKLRENGIKCSIDDFGVGYSSYSILKELPMDEIKLDAFFIKPGYNAVNDEKTLRSIISLGKSLGMKVTQEGVESPLDKARLAEYGCDVLQGYCYSRPLPKDKFDSFLLENLGAFGKRK